MKKLALIFFFIIGVALIGSNLASGTSITLSPTKGPFSTIVNMQGSGFSPSGNLYSELNNNASNISSLNGNVHAREFKNLSIGGKVNTFSLDVNNTGSSKINSTQNTETNTKNGLQGFVYADLWTSLPPNANVNSMGLDVSTTGIGNFTASKASVNTIKNTLSGTIWGDHVTGLQPGGFVNHIDFFVNNPAGKISIAVYAWNDTTAAPTGSPLGTSGQITVSSPGDQYFKLGEVKVPLNGEVFVAFQSNDNALSLGGLNSGSADYMECGSGLSFPTWLNWDSSCSPVGFSGFGFRVIAAYDVNTSWVNFRYYQNNATCSCPGNLLAEKDFIDIVHTGFNTVTPFTTIIPSDGKLWTSIETNNTNLAAQGIISGSANYNEVSHTWQNSPNNSPNPYYKGSACCSFSGFGFRESLQYTPSATQLRAKFYADDGTGGNPGTLLNETGSISILFTGVNNINLVTNVPSSGNLWGVFETNSTTFTLRYDTVALPGDTYAAHSFGSGPSPFPPVPSTNTNGFWERINYTNSIHVNSFKFDGNSLATSPNSILTNSTGGFSGVTFAVPSTVLGNHTVQASDGIFFGQAIFNVTKGLVLNPPSGPSYTNVLVSSSGFHANSNLNFTFDGSLFIPQPSVKTDHAGQFNNTIVNIPASTIGPHTVKVCDSSGTCQQATFTITIAKITNFAAGQQMGNLTSVQPIITSDTNLLALSQSLYYQNGTLVSTITFPAPITIQANIATNLNTFMNVINTQVSYYETVTSTDAFNTYVTQSNSLTFVPTHFQQSNNNFGQQNFTATNPNQVSIYYKRIDVNSTSTNLFVIYPNNFNLNCTMNFSVEQTNKTFITIPSSPIPGSSNVQSLFVFTNTHNDIVTILCTDKSSGTSATYVLTETSNGVPNFPLIQFVKNFRSGQYGTHGQIGAIDIISLICIFVAMVGLSRVNEAAGIILATIVLGFLAFFQFIQWPTLLTGAIAVIIMIAVTSTKKLPWSQ